MKKPAFLFLLFLFLTTVHLYAQPDTTTSGFFVSAGPAYGGWRKTGILANWQDGPGYSIKAGHRWGDFGAFFSYSQFDVAYPAGRKPFQQIDIGITGFLTRYSQRWVSYFELTAGFAETNYILNGRLNGYQTEKDVLGSLTAGVCYFPVSFAALFFEANMGSGTTLMDEDEYREQQDMPVDKTGRLESFRISGGLRLFF